MAVETFDPGANASGSLPAHVVDLALERAQSYYHSESDELQLAAVDVQALAPYAAHPGWQSVAESASNDELQALARFFTVGEQAHSSWTAGDKSPVIAFVAVLKSRSAFTKADGQWIKSHSDNRFLPHGNLLNRL